MNRKLWLIGVIAGLMVAVTSIHAQTFEWARKYSVTRHIKAVEFVSAKRGIAVCNRATVGTSEDGGLTWTFGSLNNSLSPDKKNSNFSDVFFLDRNLGWIVGENGVAFFTEDGGKSWLPLSTRTYIALNTVFFLDRKTGYIGGDGGKIYKTADAGATWEELDTRTNNRIGGINFTDVNNGVAFGDGGTILYTEDGGATWRSHRSPTALSLTRTVFREGKGWSIGSNAALVYTPDGGTTWELQEGNVPQSNGMPEPLWGIDFYDTKVGLIGAEFGVILRTETGGAVEGEGENATGGWTPISPRPTLNRINDIEFLDRNTVVAVGEWGTILRSTDAGKTWSKVFYNPKLNSISFADADHGMVAGHAGSVFRTSDGGSTWEEVDTQVPFQFFGVEYINPETAFIVGDNRSFIETKDGGDSWISVIDQRSETGAEARVEVGDGAENALAKYAVDFSDPANGWLVGQLSKTQRTVDNGQHWKSVSLLVQDAGILQTFYGVDAVDGMHIWSAGAGGTIAHTTDGGETWSKQTTNVFAELQDIDMLDDKMNGWSVGGQGTILNTKDGGKTWTGQVAPTSESFWAVEAVSATEAWVAGDGGTVLHTTDGGVTWLQATLPTGLTMRDIAVADDGTVWVCGEWGTILSYTP